MKELQQGQLRIRYNIFLKFFLSAGKAVTSKQKASGVTNFLSSSGEIHYCVTFQHFFICFLLFQCL